MNMKKWLAILLCMATVLTMLTMPVMTVGAEEDMSFIDVFSLAANTQTCCDALWIDGVEVCRSSAEMLADSYVNNVLGGCADVTTSIAFEGWINNDLGYTAVGYVIDGRLVICEDGMSYDQALIDALGGAFNARRYFIEVNDMDVGTHEIALVVQYATGDWYIMQNWGIVTVEKRGYSNETVTAVDTAAPSEPESEFPDYVYGGVVNEGYACTTPRIGQGVFAVLEIRPIYSGEWRMSSKKIENGDPYGRLFDAYGNELMCNDDSGGDLNFYMTCHLEAGQTYYLVAHWLDASFVGSLELIVDEYARDEFEEITTAPFVPETPALTPSYSVSDPTWVYPFVYESEGTVIEIKPCISGSWSIRSYAPYDVYAELLDDKGNRLAYDDDGAGYPDFLINYWLESGEVYYLRANWLSPQNAEMPIEIIYNEVFEPQDTWEDPVYSEPIYTMPEPEYSVPEPEYTWYEPEYSMPEEVTTAPITCVYDVYEPGWAYPYVNGWEKTTVRLVPNYGGIWTMTANSPYDTSASLTDRYGNQLAYDDDGAGNHNFSITYQLEKGEVYYLYVAWNSPAWEELPIEFICNSYDGNDSTHEGTSAEPEETTFHADIVLKDPSYLEYVEFKAEGNGPMIIGLHPSENGTWHFISHADFDVYVELMDAYYNVIAYDDDGAGYPNFSVSCNLKAWETYYIKIGWWGDVRKTATVEIRYGDEKDTDAQDTDVEDPWTPVPEESKPVYDHYDMLEPITDDAMLNVWVDKGRWLIIPVRSMTGTTWTFISNAYEGGDTYARLYDAGGNLLVENDDGAENLNFCINYPLSALRTYYLAIKWLDDGHAGFMDVGLGKGTYRYEDWFGGAVTGSEWESYVDGPEVTTTPPWYYEPESYSGSWENAVTIRPNEPQDPDKDDVYGDAPYGSAFCSLSFAGHSGVIICAVLAGGALLLLKRRKED